MKSLLSLTKASIIVLAGTIAFSSISYAEPQITRTINYNKLPDVSSWEVEQEFENSSGDKLKVFYRSPDEKRRVMMIFDLLEKSEKEYRVGKTLVFGEDGNNGGKEDGQITKDEESDVEYPAYCPIPGGKLA